MAGSKFNSKTFNPQAFGKYVEHVPKPRKNELIKSGVLKGNQDIRETFMSQTGTAYAVLPMYGRIGGDAQNYDGQTDIKATTSTTFERGIVVIGRANAWTEKDFSYDITGGVDFLDDVGNQVSDYWEDIDQDTLVYILNGIYNMTGTRNEEFVSKHTYDVTSKEGEAALVGSTTLNSAIQLASGDKKSKFELVVMHSTVATTLENLNLLRYMKYTDAQGIEREMAMGTWNGKRVLIDDGMPAIEVEAVGQVGNEGEEGYVPAQEAYTKYTTYVLGRGAFDYENIGAKVPEEMDRNPSMNGGEDTLYSRRRKVFAPFGISYTKKSQASLSPTDVELEKGVNWELVHDNASVAANRKYIDHKSIAIARIISKG